MKYEHYSFAVDLVNYEDFSIAWWMVFPISLEKRLYTLSKASLIFTLQYIVSYTNWMILQKNCLLAYDDICFEATCSYDKIIKKSSSAIDVIV